MTPRLFVYGTLMPGRLRWPHLHPFATGHRRTFVTGLLYDSGRGWPVAVLDRPAPDGRPVPGVLVDVDPVRLDACLELIDEVEDTATDELRRVSVTTTDGTAAWAYHFTRAVDALTRLDDWSAVDPALEA